MEVELIVAGPQAERYSFYVDDYEDVIVGRSSDATVFIDDPEISRRHCKIGQVGNVLVVRDIGSTNGTYINGFKIDEAHLLPEDELKLGKTKVRVRYDCGSSKSHALLAAYAG